MTAEPKGVRSNEPLLVVTVSTQRPSLLLLSTLVMSLDALPLAARLEAEEKESLKVAIATLYIELRQAKPERKQGPSPRELNSTRQRSINERPT
ncbi:hypothetical protein EV714DRAFT_273651 [Schizophyllum commune]